MPPPRRKAQAAIESTLTPPTTLQQGHQIARTVSGAGNNLYHVSLPGQEKTLLVELAPQFRSTIFLKRGGYVVIDTASTHLTARENKIDGEIVNVVGDEKRWRKMKWWPEEFSKERTTRQPSREEEGSEEESTMGKMPPGSDDDEEG